MELTWVLTPFPKHPFGREYKPRSSLCTHVFHRMDSKDPDIHAPDGNKNTPSMHHPRRRNVTTTMVGLKDGHIRKISPTNGEPHGYSWIRRKRRRRRSRRRRRRRKRRKTTPSRYKEKKKKKKKKKKKDEKKKTTPRRYKEKKKKKKDEKNYTKPVQGQQNEFSAASYFVSGPG